MAAITSFFTLQAAQHPVLVIVEDLHWEMTPALSSSSSWRAPVPAGHRWRSTPTEMMSRAPAFPGWHSLTASAWRRSLRSPG